MSSASSPPVARHYTGELGDAYFGWQADSGRVGARLEVPKFLTHTSLDADLVDFGCGGGYLLELLPARSRVGIEVNPAARQAAQSRGLRVVASAAELPEESADVVISNHALEHTMAPVSELQGLHRLLRPGGELIVAVPIDDWRVQRRPDPSDPNHHLYTWTPLLLANLLEEAGFAVSECRVITHAWPPFVEHLHRRLPPRAYDALCMTWSMLRRRRQVKAIAVRS
ncbi:MAG: hypothetical protein AVDCRST_MAG38-2336 [uncultured Solirubrobacteraceae bacterium]|uniref:Methyltransferase type 11 domain-containing protein n=1 Tax=uncultured Solirubrobacteraceae bacterium TaxID=1162706 RepID=A0A6J4S8I3_9ACTN|nr:MAG: hypothetical protein AVDCRST_MAG38-2336 [uncultured Solirubrobacteraceae bacterium]